MDEQNIVKLQILNLAVKLFLTNPRQTEILAQHVFNLARYDANYDIRDRARFLKPFIFPSNKESLLYKNAKKIFLTSKPAPQLESNYSGRESYQLSSMSHYLNMHCQGYQPLPNFPEIAPDNSVRNVESPSVAAETISRNTTNSVKTKKPEKTNRNFYSSSEETSPEASSSSSSEEESSESESESADSKSGDVKKQDTVTEKPVDLMNNVESEDSESDSEDDSDDDSSDEGTENEREIVENTLENNHDSKIEETAATTQKSNLDLLLDLDDLPPMGPIMTPSLGGFLTPMTPGIPGPALNKIDLVGPSFIPSKYFELLNKVNGYGLGLTYKFTRSPHLYSSNLVAIELQFINHSSVELTDIQIGQKNLPSGMSMHEFPPISSLAPQGNVMGILGIDFNDSSQNINFEIKSNAGTSKVNLKPPIGELVRSVTMPESMFRDERNKLRGMTEFQCCVNLKEELCNRRAMEKKIYEIVNVANISQTVSPDLIYFAGQTMSSKSLVLIIAEINDECKNVTLTVNCEKLVVGSIVMNEIKDAIKKVT